MLAFLRLDTSLFQRESVDTSLTVCRYEQGTLQNRTDRSSLLDGHQTRQTYTLTMSLAPFWVRWCFLY